jgi:hypothetical protein
MKNGWLSVIVILISSLLILCSCSRSADVTLRGNDNGHEAASESPTASSQESYDPAPEESSKAPEEPDKTPGAVIRPVTMDETGMTPIPISDLNGADVNPLIVKLVHNPWEWQEDYYASGIDQYNYVFVINSYFSEDIAGQARLGQSFDEITGFLGAPGYTRDNLILYRTSDFYLAFYGAGKANLAAFIDAPVKDYDDDFLYTLIEELNSDTFSSIKESIEKLDPNMKFFYQWGSEDGTTYYADSLFGIKVSDVNGPVIDVMNNYEGNLYIQDSGNIRFSQVFNDLDTVALMLSDTLAYFYDIDVLIESEGVLSPDGRYKAARYTENDLIVRVIDKSKRDIHVYATITDDFYWIGSHHLLYIDDFMCQPEVIDVEATFLWGENILELAGLAVSGDFRIVKVEGQIITIENTDSGEMINIKYESDSSGELSFSAV